MCCKQIIKTIVSEWFELKTGIALSDETLNKLIEDMTKTNQSNTSAVVKSLPTDKEIYAESCNYVRKIKRPNNMPNVKLRQAFKNGAKFILTTLNKN